MYSKRNKPLNPCFCFDCLKSTLKLKIGEIAVTGCLFCYETFYEPYDFEQHIYSSFHVK